MTCDALHIAAQIIFLTAMSVVTIGLTAAVSFMLWIICKDEFKRMQR